MALILKDRVQETSTTTGTGTLTLAGAVTQFQTFSSAIGNGNTTYYTIYNANGSAWEVGLGTVGAGTLSRDTVFSSSNSGSLVSFTGTLYVFCDYPASKSVNLDSNGKASYGGNSYEDYAAITTPSYVEGRSWYDSTAHALAYYNDVSSAIVHIGQDLQLKVINNTGSTIANGAPVYITSTSSGQTYPNIALAKADVAATASVIGLTNGSIANGAVGYVTAQGGIDGVNTGTFTVGQVLYLSPYSAGQLQNTIPPTGITVQVGVVSYVDSSAGKIYVKQTTPLNVPASIISGQVALANGGTNANLTASAGSVPYSTASALALSAVGTSGQVLTSQGTSAPTWTTPTTGTVTSVAASAGTGISVSGSPITGSGTITITNTAPDQTVSIASGTGISVTGTYPSFTVTNTSTSSPGGSTGQLQYNNAGAFGGVSSGTSGQVLLSNGSGSNPVFSAGLVIASNNVNASANTGGFIPPSGTTAQRPSSPVNGTTRFNTTLNVYEVYNGAWQTLAAQAYTASYLIVAGGGGGASNAGAGGGAGGFLFGSANLTPGTVYSFTVGAGGAGGSGGSSNNGSNGTNSTALSLTAIGGGYGSYYFSNISGGSGGSGGGGGASAIGSDGTSSVGGNGGNGTASSITGSSVTYGGGGGGGTNGSTAGTGGTGGGGAGASGNGSGAGTAGTANTGGGGGGGAGTYGAGGAGGSGVVIISVPTANYTGTTSGSPTVTTSGSNTIMTFTSSGSYTA